MKTISCRSVGLATVAVILAPVPSLAIGEVTFQVHLTSRSRWTNESGGGSYHVILHIVDGVVIVDHQR